MHSAEVTPQWISTSSAGPTNAVPVLFNAPPEKESVTGSINPLSSCSSSVLEYELDARPLTSVNTSVATSAAQSANGDGGDGTGTQKSDHSEPVAGVGTTRSHTPRAPPTHSATEAMSVASYMPVTHTSRDGDDEDTTVLTPPLGNDSGESSGRSTTASTTGAARSMKKVGR